MGVHNAEETVRDAVLTIEEQTEKDLELVICDDGSTDRSYAILEELAAEYSNIVLLRNPENRGLAYALNRCFRTSTGAFIARMDVDDLCKPQRFAVQKRFLVNHPEYDLVGSLMILLDDHGNESYSKAERIPTADVFPFHVPFAHPTVLMRRSVLERLGGYSVERITGRCEDLELWYRFFAAGMKGYNLQKYLYIKKEGLADYKKRKVMNGCEMCVVHIRGLHTLHAPAYRYLFAVKPVISAMIPKRIMMFYHKIRFSKK